MRGSLVTSFGRLAVSTSAPLASSSRTVLVGAAAAAVKGAQNSQPQRRVQARNIPSSSCRGYATEAAASSPYSLGCLIPAQPKKKAKRLGRGDSSGRGGTSTRGHKGQKARRGNGKPTPGFEGGQTPIMRRFPKRGFVNAFAHDTVPLNLSRLQQWIDAGRLDPSRPITVRELYLSRCIHSTGDGGVKLLGEGSGSRKMASVLSQPLHIVVSRASESAIRAVEKAGGSITCKFYTPLSLRALIKPEKWTDRGRLLPNESVPIGRKELTFYSDIRNRGYLAKLHINGGQLGNIKYTGAKDDQQPAGKESGSASIEEERAKVEALKTDDAAAIV